jgi:hypothetical protein
LLYADFRFFPASQIVPQISQWSGQSWQQGVGAVMEGLALKPEALAEGIWARDGFGPENPGLVAVKLLPQHSTAGLSLRGEKTDFTLPGATFRIDPSGPWQHPFAVLDEQTVLTGPKELLRRVAEQWGSMPRFESPIFDRLWKQLPEEVAAACLLDVQALRASNWQEPTWLMDVWPEIAPAWQVICRVPVGLIIFIREKPTPVIQAGLLCPSATAAGQVGEAVGRIVDFSRTTLEAVSQGEIPPEFDQVEGASTARLHSLMLVAVAALKGLTYEVVEDFVWIRAGASPEEFRSSTNLRDWQDLLREKWLSAGLQVDGKRQEGLLAALDGFRAKAGHLPPAAGGAVLLPPETRLGWITLILPQLGLADWHAELDYAFSWNSAQNRSVTQRELAAVINPTLGPQRQEAGFPVTHYVGVAGVGSDAPLLPASDPRAGIFGYRRTLRWEDIPDGASHTAAIFGVYQKLGPWASGGPASVRALTQRPYIHGPDGFGSGQPHGMLVGMADGSVRFIAADIDPIVLEQLAAIGDGAPENLDLLAGIGKPHERSRAIPRDTEQPSGAKLEKQEPGNPPAPIVEPDRAEAGRTAEPREPRPSAEPPSSPAEDTAAMVAARLSTELRGLRLRRIPLADAVAALARAANVPVSFDLDALQTLGISVTTPVETEIGVGTFQSALENLAKQCGLRVVADGGRVIITVPEDSLSNFTTRRYAVADLLAGRGTGKEPPGDVQNSSAGADLVGLVRTFVMPESWKENGGPAELRLQGTELEVHQSPVGHRKVEQFLEQLRQARQSADAAPRLPARLAESTKLLSGKVTVNFFEPVPLSRILRQLQDLTNVKLLVNWSATAQAGLWPEPQVTLSVTDVPLGQALEQLLLPLGLGHRVVNSEVIEIAPRKHLANLLEVEFYPVGDILRVLAREYGPEADVAAILLEMISGDLASPTWADAGGSARIYLDRPAQHLVVLQSQQVHFELAAFLARLREDLRGASP